MCLPLINQSETTSPEMYVFVHLRAIHNGRHLTRNRRFSDHFGDHLSDHFGAKKENPFLSHIFGKTQHFYIFKCFANFKKNCPDFPITVDISFWRHAEWLDSSTFCKSYSTIVLPKRTYTRLQFSFIVLYFPRKHRNQ